MFKLCRLGFISAAFLGLLLPSGCGGGGSQTPALPANTANLRVLVGSASAGAVTVQVDGAAVKSLTFPQDSGYMQVKVGSKVTVQIPGGLPPQDVPTGNFASGSNHTFLVDGWGTFGMSTMLLNDDTTAAPGSVKLRVMVAAKMTGLNDVYMMPAGSLPSGTPTLSNIALNSVSSYQVLPAGSYDVFVTAAGAPASVVFQAPTLALTAGQNRTLVLVNDCTATTCGVNPFKTITLADLM
jgi:hypothetical protein